MTENLYIGLRRHYGIQRYTLRRHDATANNETARNSGGDHVRAWTIIVFTAAIQIALSILFHIDIFHSAYPGVEFNTMTGEFVPVNDSISSIDIYHNIDYLDVNKTNFSANSIPFSFEASALLDSIGMLFGLAKETLTIEYMMLQPFVGAYVAALVQAFFYLPVVFAFIQWLTGRGANSFA